MFALNQGEVCTCPSRALIQESIYDEFMADAVARTKADQAGQPARHGDHDRRAGLQRPAREDPVLHRHRQGQEGAKVLTGGERADLGGELAGGYYVDADDLRGRQLACASSRRRSSARSSPSPASADEDDALKIANDTLYGLGAGVWTRDGAAAYRAGREIQAGRVWTNCYHPYPAHAAFGGYKQSGIGRETHKMMLDHYQQTKNLLVSYSPEGPGLLLDRNQARPGRDQAVT